MQSAGPMEIGLSVGMGFLSFISPCILPIIPSYIGYISGLSYDDLTDESKKSEVRKTTLLHSIMFVLGFSLIFTALGATATSVGAFLRSNMGIIVKIAGVIVFIFGLHMTGLLKLKFLMQDHKLEVKNKPSGYFGSFLVGLAFGAGWSPCVGAFLGSILMLASTKESVGAGITLLGAYSLGLGIPFIFTAFAFNSFLSYSAKFRKHLSAVTVGGGALLMLMGIALFAGWFGVVSAWMMQFAPPTGGH